MRKNLQLVAELTKARIAVLSTASAAAGYFAGVDIIGWQLLWVTLGVMTLAMGALALNQCQEQKLDALMERTKDRPIPSGRLKPIHGVMISWLFIWLGSMILLLGCGSTAFALGALNVLWYNGIYTPLKRKSAWAVVIGSVVGAVPPLIGWSAAGRPLLEGPGLALALFFFIWQAPHFWLLLMRIGPQYAKAGFKSASEVFDTGQLARVTFSWIAASAASVMLLPYFGATSGTVTLATLALASLWVVWQSTPLLMPARREAATRSAFMRINLYALIVVVAVSADQVTRLMKVQG